MNAWRWVQAAVVYAVHDVQLARHGGLGGIRDRNAVQAALARPCQLAAYGDPPPTACDLAAAYAFGLARSHGFSDGNKRTAWVVARLFLLDNGVPPPRCTDAEAVLLVEQIAAGLLGEAQLAAWLLERTAR